jgi:2-amino-4-hydroxy-6-hydroxymethyldihydropteridine diphosphokinase
MILIAIGSNLATGYGPPRRTVEAALDALAREGIAVRRRSRWYESAPVPASDQPRFVNGVVAVETTLGPVALLAALHRIEDAFGRVRGTRNAARPLDLDLIDYDGTVRAGPEAPILPHPRLQDRAFVLRPLAELAPGWTHPVTGRAVSALIAALPDQDCRPIE